MEYYFYQLAYRDSKVPKRFVGLNQMQCSPSFDWNWGKQTTPLHVGTSYTHDFGFYSTHQIAWAGSLKPPIAWAANTPLLKFPPYSLFRLKGGRKTIIFFSHFHGLVPDTNYKHLECFVMLGTHSERPNRVGVKCHTDICDISALRVKHSVQNILFGYIQYIRHYNCTLYYCVHNNIMYSCGLLLFNYK